MSETDSNIPKNGKILVTGGSGHVGANLVRRLLDEGHDVRCLVLDGTDNRGVDGLDVEVVSGDIRDYDSCERAVAGCNRVFHIAAKISTINALPSELDLLYKINVIGAQNMVRAALKHDVERMVLTGSFSAVGYDPLNSHEPSDESMPFYPFDVATMPYARTKALAELELYKGVAEGLDGVIATSCACVGPHDYLPSRIGRTLCDYAVGRFRAYIPGGFMFVASRDIVDGHIRAMAKGRKGQKYIFGTEFHTMDDMVEFFAHATGIKRRMIKLHPSVLASFTNLYAGTMAKRFPNIPQRLTPAAIRILQLRRRANTKKAQTELGWKPTSVRDAICEAYEFYCEQGMIPRDKVVSRAQTATAP